jgi:putative transposase
VTVAARREATQSLVAGWLSQRRAWVLLPLQRSTLSDQARPDANADSAAPVHELAQRHPRDGGQRVWALLRRRGQQVHKTHGYRLWKRAKRQVHQITRQRQPIHRTMIPVQATPPGHVWTYDFRHDPCLPGTPLKVSTVIDEFTREGLALEVAPSLSSSRGMAVLERLVAMHGVPQFIRSDHGAEFIALAVRGGLAHHQTATLYITPGCPWQHGSGESFNGTVRDAWLHMPTCHSVREARVVLAA